MRFDSTGIFWQDVDATGKKAFNRVMPEIPATDWKPVRDLPDLSRASLISVDLEVRDEGLEKEQGAGWGRGQGYIAGVGVGADDDGRWYFPIRHSIEPQDNYDPQRILDWCKVQLTRKHQHKVGANLTYDYGWLAQEGVVMEGPLWDVQFAEALLDPEALVALEILGKKYLNEGKETSVLYQWLSDYYGGPNTGWQRRNIWRSPPRLAAPYVHGDLDLPIRILNKQWPLLARHNLIHLFELECGLIPLLVAMRMSGVRVDIPRATEVRDKLAMAEKNLLAKLKTQVGFEVNPNASDSLAKAFKALNLPFKNTEPTKRNPEGKPSFTKDFLKTVEHPIGETIREIRKVSKTRGTFIESYILNGHVNGRIYPQIHQLKGDENGTIVGRFSMSDPNGQNLPSKDEEMGLMVRGCCIPDEGHPWWRKYDWSQLQYRFLAHYAVGEGADDLRRRYIEDPDADYHNMVQAIVKNVTGQDIPRKPIKNVNFGVMFGMGKETTATGLQLPMDQALKLLATIHEAAPYMKATLRACSDEAQEYGVVQSFLGRKTRFDLWEPRKQDMADRKPALSYERAVQQYGHKIKRAHTHKALAYKLQGSEGDTMKSCMLRAWREGVFAATGVPKLTVHDELDFSDHGQADDAFDYLQNEIMQRTLLFRVPISAGCDKGLNWGACL